MGLRDAKGWGSKSSFTPSRVRSLPSKPGKTNSEPKMSQEFCRYVPDALGCSKSLCKITLQQKDLHAYKNSKRIVLCNHTVIITYPQLFWNYLT